ncbi:MAG: tRNA guanosine(34) transglycosylase Tgt [Flavobacteriales bacterium]|nr:MAG: tRNA guanosine(34) transglycosylase Tgt [Flavobacteriales bacterium]
MTQDFFNLEATDQKSGARAGTIHTAHGTIQTPIFMPVGTLGTVKTVPHRDLENDVKAQIILGNTYHLMLRPGMEVMETAGGLHSFSAWKKPLLTDSGGYQVYSLAANRKIKEEGVTFQSHIDGSKHMLSPETSIDIQRSIGADIIMAFDECPPYPCEKEYARKSMHLTHRWLKRSIDHWQKNPETYGYRQELFPIVQGSVYPDLRKESAEFIASQDCVGNAIGGLSVGEPAEDMYAMCNLVCGILPQEKPRYLMGVGTPANLLECVALGVDMFDCVMPTRNGRNGMLFTQNGIINIKNQKWKNDHSPLDPYGDCYVDQMYSKAYVRHLFTANESLGKHIASLHNLRFYLWLMENARTKILEGSFSEWKHMMVPILQTRL